MTLWLTRIKQDSIYTKSLLEKLGIEVYIEPLLELRIFSVKLPDDDFQGIIFTSINGVRSYVKNITNIYYNIPIYAIGNKTGNFLKKVGFKNIKQANNNIQSLLTLLYSDLNNESILYYPRAVNVSFDLKKELELKKYKVIEQKLYDCLQVQQLSIDLQYRIKKGEIKSLLLTSVRMANTFVNLIHTYNIDKYVQKMIIFCISDNVAKIIQDICLKFYIANNATLLSILDCIKENINYESKKNN